MMVLTEESFFFIKEKPGAVDEDSWSKEERESTDRCMRREEITKSPR